MNGYLLPEFAFPYSTSKSKKVSFKNASYQASSIRNIPITLPLDTIDMYAD